FAPAQKRTNKALKRLREGSVRNIALILVELARCKKATRRNKRFVQFVDDGGFADSGIAGNQHQLRPAACYYTIERCKQGLDLARSSVQFLRDEQTIWSVVLARREIRHAPARFPFSQAAPKIALDAGRSLVSFFGSFGEEFHHDGRDTSRHTLYSFVRPHRMPGDVAMYPFKRIGSRERQLTSQHLVERDTEGIEVASRVDRAIHSPGLFGSHV